MRLAAYGALAILAAVAIAGRPGARADEANPFPSPSPVESVPPGNGGYAAIGVGLLSGSGGVVPAPSPSQTPLPFHAGSATGYSVEVLGRLSPSYLGSLRFEDTNVRGNGNPIVSRFDLSALYQFRPSHVALGLGYASLQRSSVQASSNGIGLGVALLPDFARPIAPYGSLFAYPSITGPSGTRATLTVMRLGLTISPPKSTGIFARIGVSAQNFGASAFSPTSLTGIELGVGTTF